MTCDKPGCPNEAVHFYRYSSHGASILIRKCRAHERKGRNATVVTPKITEEEYVVLEVLGS